MTNPSETARTQILDAALGIAAFEGWTSSMLREAVSDVGLPDGSEELYFPGGPLELIRYWAERCDAQTSAEIAKLNLSEMRIRNKVTAGVIARLEAIGPNDEAARRAIARTALPDAISMGPKIAWSAADTIWRAIDDKSTDFNFYTKRATLSAVIGTSMTAWLADNDTDKTKARAFVDARIENVMQFEKAKFQVKKRISKLPDPAEILGQMRYGTRRRRRR